MNSAAQMSNARAKTADARRKIAASELGDFVARLFTAAGVPDDAARVVATGLVDADLEGLHSHGANGWLGQLFHAAASARCVPALG